MVRRWSDVRRLVMSASIAVSMLIGATAWAFPPVKPAEIDAHRQALCNEGGASAEEFDAIASAYLRELDNGYAATRVFQQWSYAPADVLPLGLYEDLYSTDSRNVSRLWRHEQARLTTRYFEQLGSLEDIPGNVVERLTRAHLRHAYLEQGPRAGEPISTRSELTPDLTALVDAIVTDPAQREAIAGELAGWEQAVHVLLLGRTTPEGIERRHKFRVARTEGNEERMKALYTKMILSNAEPRELTQRALDRIIRTLPTETGRRLRDRADRILYGSLYAPRTVDHVLKAALERRDLSPAQRQQLKTIAATLERRRHGERELFKKRLDLLLGTERVPRRAAQAAARWAGTAEETGIDESDEYAELYKSFRAIGDELRKQIEAVVGDG